MMLYNNSTLISSTNSYNNFIYSTWNLQTYFWRYTTHSWF